MQRKNITEVTEFIFLGFSIFGKHQITLFVAFLTIYILTLAGDIVIVAIIRVDHHLRTPMYFFLSMLASSEAVYTLVIVPRMLFSLILHNQPISWEGCATPMFFFVTLAVNSGLLLTAMGYDRYVAICNPLRYTVVMSKGMCAGLVCGSFGTGMVMAVLHVAAMFHLPFWGTVVDHFFCDIYPVTKLSCTDSTINEMINYGVSPSVILVPVDLIFITYVLILSTSLKIPSARGRKKAFATCTSRLTVVVVHYSCASVIYLKPKSENSIEKDLLSVTYTIITPLLSPVVYSLRNREVRDALRRAVGKNTS